MQLIARYPAVLVSGLRSKQSKMSDSEKSLSSIRHTERQNTPTLQSQLAETAAQLSQALERIRELETQQADSSEQYRVMFETSYTVKLVIDPNTGRIVDANQSACQFYGYDKATLLTLKVSDINTLSEKEIFEAMQNARAVQQQFFDFRHRLANGDVRDVEVFTGPIHIQGQTRLYSIIHDVTKRKAREQELRLLWHAVNQSANSVIITDALGNIQYVNPYFVRLTGYTLLDVIGQKPSILSSGETSPEEYQHLWETITAQHEWSGEFHNRKKNGELYWEHASISPMIDENGNITHYIAIKEDITAQKKVWEELRRKEYALRRSQAVAHVGDWEWDIQSSTMTWSDELYRIYGVDQSTFTGNQSAVTDDLVAIINQAVHPDDRERVYAANQAVIEGNKPHGIEYRVVWPDGSIRYHWAQPGHTITDAKGDILNMSGVVQDITDRKQIEIRLQQAERFARSTVDSLSAHIAILDEQGMILATNHAWRRFAEQNAVDPDLVGIGANYLAVLEIVDPASEDVSTAWAVRDAIQRILSAEINSFSLEYPCHSPNEQRWFMVHITRFAGDGPVCVVIAHENITERVLAENRLADYNAELEAIVKDRTAQLHRLNDRMNTILNNVSNPILLVEADGKIDATNPAFNKKLGYEPDELFSQPLWTIFDPAYHDSVINLFKAAQQQQRSLPLQVQLISKDGTLLDAEVSLTYVLGNSGHVVCTLYDISHLKEVERIKDEFVSMVSHELRTPITSMLLSSSTILRYYERLSEDQKRRKQEQINQQAEILHDLVSSILDISRLDTRRGKLKPDHTFDMGVILREVVAQLEAEVLAKQQYLQVEVVNSMLTFTGDQSDMVRVWRNLLSNAIKYSPEASTIHAQLYGACASGECHSPDLTAFAGQIPANLNASSFIIGLVKDHGHGIPADNLPQLFTRFYRGWAATTNITGSGLGLSYVRDLLRLYNGDIAVSSEQGVGTTFCFWLPSNQTGDQS